MTLRQLTLDGGEVEHPAPPGRARLSGVQRAILRHLGLHGRIRSLEAGRLLHEERFIHLYPQIARRHGIGQTCPLPESKLGHRYKGEGCCWYASSDGSQAMKRLADRGLVERTSPGLWITTTTELDRAWGA